MGRDKAMLATPGGGPLWRRQWRILEALDPAEMMLSCRSGQELPGSEGVRRVEDPPGEGGPLAAVTGILRCIRTPLLLVLAVDLPEMTAATLGRLLDRSGRDCGAVFVRDRLAEPLAAVYPVRMAEAGRMQIAAGRRDLQTWVRTGLAMQALTAVSPSAEDARALFNLNDPAALREWMDRNRPGAGGG